MPPVSAFLGALEINWAKPVSALLGKKKPLVGRRSNVRRWSLCVSTPHVVRFRLASVRSGVRGTPWHVFMLDLISGFARFLRMDSKKKPRKRITLVLRVELIDRVLEKAKPCSKIPIIL